jgi:drug/metabolite transporter (DMT)-like permease
MTKILCVLLIGLVFEATGVVFLSKGLKEVPGIERMSVAAVLRLVKAGATNGSLLLGVFCEAVFFGTLLWLMSKSDVSFVWPLTSLGFVLTTIAARFILHEQVSALRWAGVLLIVVGAGIISWTEQTTPKTGHSSSGGSLIEDRE